MTKYRCYFCYLKGNKKVIMNVIVPGPAWLEKGLWLSKALRFTQGDNAHIWIPPSRIYKIVKEKG